MINIVETAHAKVNLTLRVHGRRGDGYHEIESLVAFAAIGDRLTLRRAATAEPALTVTGPFAGAIVGDNLVARAMQLVASDIGQPLPVDVELEKLLPVASGIGGGSADAAALLRAVRSAFPESAAHIDWMTLARQLGADVSVCFLNQPALMTGTGEHLTPVALPRLDIVLANSLAPVPADKTRRVFAALAAAPVGQLPKPSPPELPDRDSIIALVRGHGNDLERAAISVLPAIAEVKSAVAASTRCRHALLSGAGPTIAGLYDSASDAMNAAIALEATHPAWWVRATSIGG